MARLLVRLKDGTEREMEQKQYDLIGFKRKPQIIGEVKPKVNENDPVAKAKAELIARKEAGLPLVVEGKMPEKEEPKQELKGPTSDVVTKNKGGRPKLNKTEDEN